MQRKPFLHLLQWFYDFRNKNEYNVADHLGAFRHHGGIVNLRFNMFEWMNHEPFPKIVLDKQKCVFSFPVSRTGHGTGTSLHLQSEQYTFNL